MDYRTFSKPKMWANVSGGIICYIMFAYELYACIMNHSSIMSSLLFLFLAVNCTFRVFSFTKLNRLKKDIIDENQFGKAEHRQSIIISIFSNATATILMLVYLIHSIRIQGSLALNAMFAVFVICFGVILVQTIQNLKRFDRM